MPYDLLYITPFTCFRWWCEHVGVVVVKSSCISYIPPSMPCFRWPVLQLLSSPGDFDSTSLYGVCNYDMLSRSTVCILYTIYYILYRYHMWEHDLNVNNIIINHSATTTYYFVLPIAEAQPGKEGIGVIGSADTHRMDATLGAGLAQSEALKRGRPRDSDSVVRASLTFQPAHWPEPPPLGGSTAGALGAWRDSFHVLTT